MDDHRCSDNEITSANVWSMAPSTKYVLDATMGWPPVFCPVELDENGEIISVIVGINLITDRPPGPVIAVVHEDGQEAVERFCEEHAEFMKELLRRHPEP